MILNSISLLFISVRVGYDHGRPQVGARGGSGGGGYLQFENITWKIQNE